jgi:bifunctional enzyme CysN/CysC
MNAPLPSALHQARAFPIVIVGHVDHGKSTLVGRLLHETGALPDGKAEQLRAISARRGLEFEWSFLLDSLQVERDQGITVDTTQIWFHTAKRRYVIIDAPGHKEFVRNMVTGAAAAEAAVLVVDAVAGLSEQTRRHAYLLSLLGLSQIALAVNKIDLVGHAERRFDEVAEEVGDYLAGIGLEVAAAIPISARNGDNVAGASAATPWYRGPTLLAALDAFQPRASLADRPLRLPVQDVLRRGDRRILLGRIESGRIAVGDDVLFLPGRRLARIQSIESWAGGRTTSKTDAAAGESVAITVDDEVFVERGTLAVAPAAPPPEGTEIAARLFWLAPEPLAIGQRLTLRHGTTETEVTVAAIDQVVDIESLDAQAHPRVERNGIAAIRLTTRRPIALDTWRDNATTGRGTLMLGHRVVGGIIVDRVAEVARATNVTAVAASVGAVERARANGHRGGVLWLTGHSGAGKSTLAMGALRALFERGWQVQVLDGDNLRRGLNADLGFSEADRAENIRRTAEVARLMADAGMVVIAALISPRAADRATAAGIVGDGFHEIHVAADLATCRARDPKGLYAKAEAGEIQSFTGVSAPYEAPTAPALRVDTTALDPSAAIEQLVDYAAQAFRA